MTDVNLDLKGRKILVTDDVPANLDVLFQALDSEGYNVHVASDGVTALEVAEHSMPDLILLDVMMPGIDGYETCRRLKADGKLADIPVIFLSARDDIEGIVEGFQAGGADYVTKPFKKEEVLARIRTHLERALLARDLAELNAHLEQKVQERTRELQLKVRELEGKDRIAEHLLTFNSLEETLAVVLEVITDIVELDQAVVYLKSQGELKAVAATGSAAEALGEGSLSPAAEPAWARAVTEAEEQMEPVQIEGDHPRALVPIFREGLLLGFIEVENPRNQRPITDADLRTLGSFAMQAAVAIKDAQVRLDPDEWKDQLDEVLELDREAAEVEGLEDLGDK